MIILDPGHLACVKIARRSRTYETQDSMIKIQFRKDFVYGFLVDESPELMQQNYVMIGKSNRPVNVIVESGNLKEFYPLPLVTPSFCHGYNDWDQHFAYLLRADFAKNKCTVQDFLNRAAVARIGVSYQLFNRQAIIDALPLINKDNVDFRF